MGGSLAVVLSSRPRRGDVSSSASLAIINLKRETVEWMELHEIFLWHCIGMLSRSSICGGMNVEGDMQ